MPKKSSSVQGWGSQEEAESAKLREGRPCRARAQERALILQDGVRTAFDCAEAVTERMRTEFS